jgi:hypothetical protein
MKLGAIHTPRPASIRALASLVRLPDPKPETDWLAGIDFSGSMLDNDAIGDCVPRSAYQIARVRAHHVWGPDSFIPTTDQVLAAYETVGGYNPADPTTDRGTDTNSFLGWWASHGLPLTDQTDDVIGWAHANLAETPVAVDLAGPVRMTLALPAALEGAPVASWGDAPGIGDAWAPGTWGAHSVMVGGQRGGFLNVETWTETAWCHPLFLARYWLATDVPLSRLWFDTTGLAPSALDFDALAADVAAIGGT